MSSTQKTIVFSSRSRYFPSRCQKSSAMTRVRSGRRMSRSEVRRRVPLAVGADVALFVQVRDPLVEQVGNEVPVLDRLLQRVRVSRIAKVVERVASALRVGEPAAALDLSRRRGQTELVGLAEMLQHAEPVAESRAMALVHDDQTEEVGIEVLKQLLAVKPLRPGSGSWRRTPCRPDVLVLFYFYQLSQCYIIVTTKFKSTDQT